MTKSVESNIDIDKKITCSIFSMESLTISDDSETDSNKEQKNSDRKSEDSDEEEDLDEKSESISGEDYMPSSQKKKTPKIINQEKLNALVRDLGLPKDKAEYLALFMKDNNYQKARKHHIIKT